MSQVSSLVSEIGWFIKGPTKEAHPSFSFCHMRVEKAGCASILRLPNPLIWDKLISVLYKLPSLRYFVKMDQGKENRGLVFGTLQHLISNI